jgi:hypothetical protein
MSSGSGAVVGSAAPSGVAAPVLATIQPIAEWLVSVNPHLGRYAQAFIEYGYDDTDLLMEATEEDIEEAVDELEMKKGHRRAFLNALGASG